MKHAFVPNRRLMVAVLIAGTSWGCTGSIDGTTSDDQGGRGDGSANASGSAGTGTTSNPGTGGTGGDVTADLLPSVTVLRRLNATEYNNTVLGLLGDSSAPSKTFPPDERALGFDNNGAALTASPVLVEAQLAAAEALAKAAVTKLSTLVPCAAAADDACARQFITQFGERAFRRPVEKTDTDRLMALYTSAKADGGFAAGIELALAAMLSSPRFLYRVETSPKKLDGWERASRLSYMLWQSMPDAALFDAARAGMLDSPAGIAKQAERMLGDSRARVTVADFHAQWLKYKELPSVTKSTELYPDFTADVAGQMRQELDAFVNHAAFEAPSTFEALMKGNTSFLNASLAAFYRLPAVQGDKFGRVGLDAKQRSGLLTRGGILATLSHKDQTSPTLRGKFIRTQLLCEHVPPPPPAVVNSLPMLTPTTTARERMLQHTQNPQCRSCHAAIDPLGFGLEHLDPVGRWREMDGGKVVDASGSVLGTDVEGAFNGANELAVKLASSKQAAACWTRQLFRFGLGRKESGSDEATLQRMLDDPKTRNGTLTQWLVALATSEAFGTR